MRLKDAQVLITGAAGLIGRHLVARLAHEGVRVRAAVRKLPVEPRADVEYIRGDLTRPEDCAAAVAGIDCVFHCAAVVTSAAGATNPLAAVTENARIHSSMLDAAYRAGVKKFVWLASTIAYPPTGDRPVREEELFDGQPFEKYFAAGSMYRFVEALCETYARRMPRAMATVVLRPSNVYGPGQSFELGRSHVSAALMRRVVERQDPLEVWGTGDDVRDLIYVDDVVEAVARAAEGVEGYAALNVGLGKGYSIKQILRILLDLEGFEPNRVVYDASKPTMIPVRLVDVSAAQRVLGFKAAIDLPEGLRRTMAWYKGQRQVGVV
jgi:GDP-L-fucose synthase